MDAKHFVLQVALDWAKVPSPDVYPYCLPAVRAVQTLDLHPAVTFLVGENGTGKSTLLEAIAVATGFNAEGGSRNFNFATRATHSELHNALRVVRGVRRPRDNYFLRAESFYNVASEIDRLGVAEGYGGKSLHHQSHGEAFMALLLERFSGNGLYLLDEPESALSPSRQLAMLARMRDLVRMGSQFIIATHSPILMAYPDACIYVFDQTGVHPTPYTETEHYILTRRFLGDHTSMLQELFAEDAEPFPSE